METKLKNVFTILFENDNNQISNSILTNKKFKNFISNLSDVFNTNHCTEKSLIKTFCEEIKLFLNFIDLNVIEKIRFEIEKFTDLIRYRFEYLKNMISDHISKIHLTLLEFKFSLTKNNLKNLFDKYINIINKEKINYAKKNKIKLDVAFNKIKNNITEYFNNFKENKIEENKKITSHFYIKIIKSYYSNFYKEKLNVKLLNKKKDEFIYNQFISIINKLDKNYKKIEINEILVISAHNLKIDNLNLSTNIINENNFKNVSLEDLNESISNYTNENKKIIIENKCDRLQYIQFADRNILNCLSGIINKEYFDYKIYHTQKSINSFIIENVSNIIRILKFNPNALKLFIEEEPILSENNIENIDKFYKFKVVKISRTPAYGIKKIIINLSDNPESFISLKPTQIFLLILSKSFADAFLNLSSSNMINVINKELAEILNNLKYDREFYKKNYDNLIDKFYVGDKEIVYNTNYNDSLDDFNQNYVKINSDFEIHLTQLNNIEMDLLISSYFNLSCNELTLKDIFSNHFITKNPYYSSMQIFTNFKENYVSNLLIFIYLPNDKNNSKFLIKKEFEKIFEEIKRNPIHLLYNKIEYENKYFKILFSDVNSDDKILDDNNNLNIMENSIKNLIKCSTVDDFITNSIKIKSTYLKILNKKEKTLLEIKKNLLKIQSEFKLDEFIKEDFLKNLKILIEFKYEKNIKVLKFIIEEIQLILKQDNLKSNSIMLTNNSIDISIIKKSDSLKRNDSIKSQIEKENLSMIEAFNNKIKNSKNLRDSSKRPKSSNIMRKKIDNFYAESNISLNKKTPIINKNYFVTNINLINTGKIIKLEIPKNSKVNINTIPNINIFNKNSKKITNDKKFINFGLEVNS